MFARKEHDLGKIGRTEPARVVNLPASNTIYLSSLRKPLFLTLSVAVGLFFLSVASNEAARRANDQKADEWALSVGGALNDPSSLREGQSFYERVRVVGAGVDYFEKLQMDAKKDRFKGKINVRRGPGTEEIGFVEVGELIPDVLIQQELGSTKCATLTGLIPNSNRPLPEICTIDWKYLHKA